MKKYIKLVLNIQIKVAVLTENVISGGIVFDVELSKRILAGDVNREKPISIDEKDGALTFAN